MIDFSLQNRVKSINYVKLVEINAFPSKLYNLNIVSRYLYKTKNDSNDIGVSD